MTSHVARRLPVHRGPAAWSLILPDPGAPVVPDADQGGDFAIIGAGFAGLSAARHLHRLNPQARILVLEAGRIAEGASGRNSGFMIDLPHDLASDDYAGGNLDADRELIALNRSAIAFAQEAAAEYDIRPDYLDPAGKVNGAASEKADRLNASYAAYLTRIGEPSERLDAQAMRDLTGSAHYLSGLYTRGTLMLQPAGYIRGLAAGLRRTGVQVFEHSPVTRLERQGDGWTLTLPRARVRAGRVILANNGHLESFGFARNRLMHVFLFASMSAELGPAEQKALGGAPRWGVTPSDPMGTTLRRIDTAQGGNRIITRTCAAFEPGMETGEAALRRATRIQKRKFAEWFPQLRGVAQQYSWAGHLCLSRNDVSVMRELEPGLYAACVCNGLGTTRSTLTGIAAAELASGRDSAITRHFLAEDPPARLPPPPLSTIGATAVLRWREYRARDE